MTASAAVREVLIPIRPRRWPVDAGGVPAEWVEVRAATVGQSTLVCFPGPEADGFRIAGGLAVRTNARVLVVSDCSVDAGVAVWAWLLHEGCDPSNTTFVGTSDGTVRAFDVLAESGKRGLRLPDGGVWTVS